MNKDIPEELQKEFVDVVDSYIYKAITSTKRKYERKEEEFKAKLILNKPINELGEELMDTIANPVEDEYHWDFLDTIESPQLYHALKTLSRSELLIIKLKFLDGLTDDEIKKTFHHKSVFVTRNYTNRILRKLKRRLIKVGDFA